jgi:hypothetical protein
MVLEEEAKCRSQLGEEARLPARAAAEPVAREREPDHQFGLPAPKSIIFERELSCSEGRKYTSIRANESDSFEDSDEMGKRQE